MADISQKLVDPFYVQLNDGKGKAFVFLVTKVDDGEHYSGTVWCDDADNELGLSAGTWTPQVQIGRGGPDSGASWSPIGALS